MKNFLKGGILVLGFLFFTDSALAMTVTECQSAPPAGRGGTCVDNWIQPDCIAPSRGNPGQTNVGACLGGRSGNQDMGSCCVNNSSGNGNPTTGGGGGSPTTGGGNGNPTTGGGGGNPTTTGGGGANAGAPVMISFSNPLQYGTVEEVFTSIIGTAQSIVVLLALVFLVIGALLYITSGGNDKRIGAAKACITAALVGLVIIMVAPSFLKEIANVLGWTNVPSVASAAPTISEIATKVLNFLLSIIGIIAIIMFLVGSVMYLTSAGDEKRVATGKAIVKAAIIGMIVAFSALVIVRQLADFFIP